MTTVAMTLPEDFNLSSIRGHPPIDTSPRPSATGNLQAANKSTEVVFLTPLSHSNFLPDFLGAYHHLMPQSFIPTLSPSLNI
jgi:hypothetical protein